MANEKALPEDALTVVKEHDITIDKQEAVIPYRIFAEQMATYTGQQRRDFLDTQIELLYDRTIRELSNYPADVALALKKLSIAHDLVLEQPQQYDAALSQMAEVKMILVETQLRQQWSFTWGFLVLFYAVIWFVVLAVGFFVDVNGAMVNFAATIESYKTIWFSALAGGLGAIVAVLRTLSLRTAKNEFDRQDVLMYLIQPITGLILGTLIFFMANTGFLALDNTLLVADEEFLTRPQLLLVILGWIAGYCQQNIYRMIDQILARVLPKQN